MSNPQHAAITVQGGATKTPQTAYPYGTAVDNCCPPIFNERCFDGNINTFYDTTTQSDLLLRWVGGFRAAQNKFELQKYLPYFAAPAGTGDGTPVSMVPLNCCTVGNGIEMPEDCNITQDCFGLIKVKGDDLCDGGNDLDYCTDYPRLTVGGERIDTTEDWQVAQITDVAMWSVNCELLEGEGTFEFSGESGHWGLYPLFGFNNDNTVYPDFVYNCDYVKPDVVDWAGNPACGTADLPGVTINGTAYATDSIYNTIRLIVKEKMKVLRRMRTVGNRTLQFGDIAIALPDDLIECLLRCQACYLWCDGSVTRIDNAQAQERFFQSLSDGIGFGALRVNSMLIPFIPYDPVDPVTGESKMRNDDGTFNFFMLVRGAGNTPFLYPEFNPLDDSISVRRGNNGAETRNNGQFLFKQIDTDDCTAIQVRTDWRWNNRAPYMQTLFKNVSCDEFVDLNGSQLPITAALDRNCPPAP